MWKTPLGVFAKTLTPACSVSRVLAVVRVPSSDRDLFVRQGGCEDGGAARWTDRLPGAHTGVGDEAGGLLDRRASSDQGPAPTISRKRRLISIAKSVRASEAMLQKP